MAYYWHPVKKILIEHDEATDSGSVIELTPVVVRWSDRVVAKEEGGGELRKKKQKRPDVFDTEKVPRKRVDKEQVKRLLKESDMSTLEIAEKVGASKSVVYLIKAAMQRDGELA